MRRRKRSRVLSTILAVLLVGGILAVWQLLPGIGSRVLNVGAPTPSQVNSAPTVGGTPVPGAPASTPSSGQQASSAPTAVPTILPTPVLSQADAIARQYLTAWGNRQYAEMYGLLSTTARGQITQERFINRFEAITSGATINKVTAKMSGQQQVSGASASYPIQVDFETGRFGTFGESNVLPLVVEDGAWRIDWTPNLIFRDLSPDNRILMQPYDPPRGAIVDRNGKPLAIQGKVLTLGLIPGRIENEAQALNTLAEILGEKPEDIKQKYQGAQPDWWVPLRDYPLDQKPALQAKIKDIEGVLLEEKDARVYPHGSLAAHVIGFVGAATADDLASLAARGYDEGEIIGRAGIEASQEQVLAGVRGGKLAVVTPEGDVVRTIAERQAETGGSVQLTIDIDAQKKAEDALGEKTGSVVLLDPRDNNVLALASFPRFDPNLFVLGISDADWKRLSTDARNPFQNRPTLSAYPTGSIFKVITMVAGIERGGYTPASQFECKGSWAVLDPRRPFGDWKPQGHGRLDLSEGLVQSCNIVFYEIGHSLDKVDPNILPEYARQFGLGEVTGINGLQENSGAVPAPDWKQKILNQVWFPGDAVNLAIGQGYLEATPLQMANVYATIANGGAVRTPLLVQKILTGEPGRQQEKSFTSQELRRLGASAATLTAVREAMVRTASSPAGTANYAFRGYEIPTAAKTGSAENQNPDAHAWFAGFAPANDPRVVVIVMVEGGRMGSEVAAPIARKALQDYLGSR
ncbi:MAG TPA: penicillin-binding protein 2 [Chloroflexota bacterium]|nr:penicillin-binding protein 2 [Chloroflexota bacterium]